MTDTKTKIVDINQAQTGETFLWQNYSTVIFPGFYDTIIGPSCWLDRVLEWDSDAIEEYKKRGEEPPKYLYRDYDDFEKRVEQKNPMFYPAYREIVAKEYSKAIWEEIKDAEYSHIITSWEFDHIWRPKYYNYQTDQLCMRLTADWNALNEFIEENLDEFKKYLLDVWTSKDQRVSRVPNTYAAFINSSWNRDIGIEYVVRSVMLKDSARYEEDTVKYRIYDFCCDLDANTIIMTANKMEARDDYYG